MDHYDFLRGKGMSLPYPREVAEGKKGSGEKERRQTTPGKGSFTPGAVGGKERDLRFSDW